ncbi:MAG TPA: 2-amino-4-hydroxy-6-hydroxymethyldihydropteridine pyrophosphokinase [Lachnospiraceae bacterium]|nr:2-amino-4-hydroxy-6-hydroxymethyldihydropteridine pyrophosphokinase [Lachnospiraceae bacterium]
MDEIKITGIEFYAYHGVLEKEKQEGQYFSIDCYFTLDTSLCDDILDNTVNYSDLSCDIVEFCQSEKYDLIETLANNLAKHLLLKYSLINNIHLTVHKPSAPIPTKFDDVTITITRGWNICYLSLGSNLGDRKKYLDDVSKSIALEKGIVEISKSSYVETEPYGVLDQPPFLNAAMKIKTIFTPMELLSFIHKLEQSAGRERKRHWGERTLDVDILMYGDCVIFTPELTIPHAEMYMRKFVLEPLFEIEPYLIHPTRKMNIKEMLENL